MCVVDCGRSLDYFRQLEARSFVLDFSPFLFAANKITSMRIYAKRKMHRVSKFIGKTPQSNRILIVVNEESVMVSKRRIHLSNPPPPFFLPPFILSFFVISLSLSLTHTLSLSQHVFGH